MNKTNHSFVNFGFICDEDLSQMPKTEKGTHCTACKKEVVDFSVFSSSEAFNYLKKNKSVCGSMSARKLEELNTYTGLKQSRSFSLKSMLTSLTLGVSSLVMSQKETKVLYENENLKVLELATGINPDSLINNKIIGIVTDENGEPLPFIRVFLNDANQKMMTDIEGKFNVLYDADIPGNIQLQITDINDIKDSSLVAQNYDNKMIQIMIKNSYNETPILTGIVISEPIHPIQKLDTKIRAIYRYNDK